MLTVVSQREFALKKIRCPTGSEDVRQAMREVEAYRRFKCADFHILHSTTRVLIYPGGHLGIQISFVFL
jgi:hypothetical protein